MSREDATVGACLASLFLRGAFGVRSVRDDNDRAPRGAQEVIG